MQRIRELDSIRGLAALAIVIFHLWLRQVGALGLAVNVFFVLSGYLITSIILNNELTDHFLITFYARRCLRIWPIYYLTLAILVLVNPWLPTPGNLEEWPYYLTYTQGIAHSWVGREPTFPDAFQHTWTLAIEEQFYLFWPALLWMIGRRRLPLIAFILIVLAVFARALGLNRFILITQCDGLALGGLLAYLMAARERFQSILASSRRRLTVLSVIVSGLLFGFLVLARGLPGHRLNVVGNAALESLVLLASNLILFAMTAVVVLNAGKPWLVWLRDKRLVYLGTISYGLYLYHQFLFNIWDNYATYYGWRNTLATDLAKVGASVAIASLSWRFVERPILTLKDRFLYQSAAAPELDIPGTVNELGRVEAG